MLLWVETSFYSLSLPTDEPVTLLKDGFEGLFYGPLTNHTWYIPSFFGIPIKSSLHLFVTRLVHSPDSSNTKRLNYILDKRNFNRFSHGLRYHSSKEMF